MEDNNTVERLVIELGYDSFMSNMKKMIGQYHDSVKQIGIVSANIGKTVVDMNKQIQNQLPTLGAKSSEVISKQFQEMKTIVASSQSATTSALKEVERSIKSMNDKVIEGGRVLKEYKENMSALSNISIWQPGKTGTTKADSAQIDRMKSALTDELKVAQSLLSKEMQQNENKYFMNVSNLAVKSTEAISKAGEVASRSIVSGSQSAINSLSRIKDAALDTQKNVQIAFSNQSYLKEIKNQHDTLYSQLEALNKRRLDAEKALNLARVSMNQQTDAVMFSAAEQNYQKAMANFNKLNLAYKTAMDKYKSLQTEFAKVSAGTPQGFSDVPIVKSQEQFKRLSTELNNLWSRFSANVSKFSGLKLDKMFDLTKGVEFWKEQTSMSKSAAGAIQKIEKQITQYQETEEKLRTAAAQSGNAKRATAYTAYANVIKGHIDKLQMTADKFKSVFDKITASTRNSLLQGAQAYNTNVQSMMKSWSNIDSLKSKMIGFYETVEVYASRSGQKNQEMARQAKVQFADLSNQFIQNKSAISNAINNLKQLTGQKLIDARPTIEQLELMLQEYNKFNRQMTGMAGGVAKMMRAQAQAMNKGFFGSLWEGIRNFRWQIAALYYLVTKFVGFIKNTFLSVLNEIDQFRRGAYALTASVGLVMGKGFVENFDAIYDYSREVMEKLQAKAGATYASLEEMMMVTRSFAQAGIFPKTDEDIDKIATLSTAVKVMTEGMANAGVQMRQEIMALIEGRTRVTDSVAMAFKMQGINLKKEMEEWERLGIDKLTGFSKLLAPFAEINKRLSQEYGSQVNNLKEMWNYIKRIAGEKLVLEVAKDLKNFVDTLGAPGKALTEFGTKIVDTIKGSMVVFYELLKGIGVVLKDVFNVLDDIFGTFGNLVRFLDEGNVSLTAWGAAVKGILVLFQYIVTYVRLVILPFSTLVSWANSLALYLYAVKQILAGDLVKAAGTLKEAGEKAIAPFKQMGDIWNDYNKGLDRANELAVKLNGTISSNKGMQGAVALLEQSEAHIGWMKNLTSLYGEWDKAIEKNADKHEKASTKISKWREEWNRVVEGMKSETVMIDKAIENVNTQLATIPVNTQKSGLEVQKQSVEIQIATMSVADSLLTVADANSNAIINMSGTLGNTVRSQIAETKSAWQSFLGWLSTAARSVFLDIDPNEIRASEETSGEIKEKPKVQNVFEQQRNKLAKDFNDLQKRKADIQEEMVNGTKKLEQAESSELGKAARGSKTVVDHWKEYLTLLDKIGAADPFEKLKTEIWELFAELDKAAQSNPWVQENYYKMQQAIWEKYNNEFKKLAAEKADNIRDLNRKIMGAEATDFEKIKEQYEDYGREIDELVIKWQLGAEAKALWDAKLATGQDAAMAKEQVKHMRELAEAELEVWNLNAQLIGTSVSPFAEQKQKLIELEIEWKKFQITQQKALEEAKVKYGENSVEFQHYTELMKQQFALQEQLYQEHLKEVQYPFWAKMKELSSGWVDSISDALTDLLFEFDSFGQGVTDMMKNMAKEVVNTIIKEQFVKPIVGSLSGAVGGNGGMWLSGASGGKYNPLQMLGLVPKSGEGQQSQMAMPTVGNPMPVMVTNLPAGSSLLGGGSTQQAVAVEQQTQQITSTINQNMTNVSSNVNSGFTGMFGNLKSGFSTLWGFVQQGFGSLINGLQSLFSSLGGMFGGGGGSGGGGIMSMLGGLFGSGGTSGGGGLFGMSGGGIIREPIIGGGLRSGNSYAFGENGSEAIVPMNKTGGRDRAMEFHMPVYISAIDTQSGMEFLMKNSSFIEAKMGKSIRQNKRLRGDIRRGW